MSKKKKEMSPEEMEIQRALGTLNKFEIALERTIKVKSFARAYVMAADEEGAKKRALQINEEGGNDDSGCPISWADNQDGEEEKAEAVGVRPISDTDAHAHRFNKDFKEEEDKNTIDITTIGKPI